MEFEKQKEFSHIISTEELVIKNGGHLNTESGYSKFEKLKDYIES